MAPLAGPEDRPIGRAALELEADGIGVVFGHEASDGRMTGFRAQPGAWIAVERVPIAAVYDRFPERSRAVEYEGLLRGLAGVPRANPPGIVALCSDKIRAQEVLVGAGIPMPEVEARSTGFAAPLERWGAAFLKPRFGAFGRGVRRVRPGDPLPDEVDGAVPGEPEPAILQRAVPPPPGWAGVSCRVLVQRVPPGQGADWWVGPPVLRRDRDDPVVNAARGAEVVALDDAWPAAVPGVRALARRCAAALGAEPEGDQLVEVGVDVVLDDQLTPWVIEVNSRPRGRLEALARLDPSRFAAQHLAACARPLRFLAARYLQALQ